MFRSLFQSFERPLQVIQLQLISLSPPCSTAFLLLWQGPRICKTFYFLLFPFVVCWNKINERTSYLSFVDLRNVWSSGLDKLIRLDLQIPSKIYTFRFPRMGSGLGICYFLSLFILFSEFFTSVCWSSTVVWMVSTWPLIVKSSSPFNSPLVYILSKPITIGITDSRFPILYLSLRFLSFFLVCDVFLIISRYVHLVEIRWYEFVHLILQEEIWIVYIRFIRMFKFKFIALFPVDTLPFPFQLCLV